jgi:hypothetical protein
MRRAAVVTIGDRLRIITDFATGDEFRGTLARATDAAVTQTAADLAAVDAHESRQRGLIDGCSLLASVSGPKAIIYFSTAAQLPVPDQRTTAIDPFAAIQSPLGVMPRACTAANVRLYVIDPRELPR